jgi:DNA-binding NarL/FixJ family response regulator
MKNHPIYSHVIRIGIVEDEKAFREAVQEYFGAQKEFSCSHAHESAESFLSQLTEDDLPDVVLMDIGLPGMSGISAIKLLKERYPDIDIIMLTVYHDPDKIFRSLCAGATGYLLKTAPMSEIREAIQNVYSGGSPMSHQIARKVIDFFHSEAPIKPESSLTAKEREVITGLVEGLSYKLIATEMNVTIETIRSHIKNIYRKLHVHSKAEVISKSFRGEI